MNSLSVLLKTFTDHRFGRVSALSARISHFLKALRDGQYLSNILAQCDLSHVNFLLDGKLYIGV